MTNKCGDCGYDNGGYSYNYPMPSVTVDAVIFCKRYVLLIKRRDEPFKDCWALPGGFMNIDETLLQAVVRETKEESNLDIGALDVAFIGPFDAPNRDARGRVISFAYYTEVSPTEAATSKAGDDAKQLGWFHVENLPNLAFDHAQIINQAIELNRSY